MKTADELKLENGQLKKQVNKLTKQLEDEKKVSRRMRLDAQRWFDMCMDYMHKDK